MDGSDGFFIRGVRTAFFIKLGKVDSVRDRFINVVIGTSKESRQAFRSCVGIESREQVALEEDKIADRTSSIVAGEKSVRMLGENGGGGCSELSELQNGGNFEHSTVILSLKKFRKDSTSTDGDKQVGRTGEVLRFNNEFRVDHSFLGCVEQLLIILR